MVGWCGLPLKDLVSTALGAENLVDLIVAGPVDVMSTLVTSSNTLSASTPSRISLEDVHGPVLEPGQSFELHLLVQAHVARPFELAILFVFREVSFTVTDRAIYSDLPTIQQTELTINNLLHNLPT